MAGGVVRRDDTWTVTVQERIEYDVAMVPGAFDLGHDHGLFGKPAGRARRRLVLVDAEVERIYGERIGRYLDAQGIVHDRVPVESGEPAKTLATVEALMGHMVAAHVPRRDEPVIVIGGGVLLDAAGMAASQYRRGVPWVRVPTTLVGAIDAGIGIKTAVDFLGHKNKIGTFHPGSTVIDLAFLASVDRRRISDGLGEVVKVAVMRDRALFELLEQYGPQLLDTCFQAVTSELGDVAAEVVGRAIDGMLDELSQDLYERGDLRRAMDYGHTWGPALEMAALPDLLHGESVALDMALSAVIAAGRELLEADDLRRVLRLLRRLGLAIWHPVMTMDVVGPALAEAVSHRGGQQHVPMPTGIGRHTFVADVAQDEVRHALSALAEMHQEVGEL